MEPKEVVAMHFGHNKQKQYNKSIYEERISTHMAPET